MAEEEGSGGEAEEVPTAEDDECEDEEALAAGHVYLEGVSAWWRGGASWRSNRRWRRREERPGAPEADADAGGVAGVGASPRDFRMRPKRVRLKR